MDIRRITDPAEWESLAASFPDYSYEQTWEFSRYAADRIGGSLMCYCLHRNGRPIALAAGRKKTLPGFDFGVVNIPAAPLLRDPQDALDVLKVFRENLVEREKNVLRLRLAATLPENLLSEAELHAIGFAHTSRANPYQTCLLDLSSKPAQLRKNLHSKWRGHLNKSEKFPLVIEAGHSNDMIERFSALYYEMKTFKDFESSMTPEFLHKMDGGDLNFEVLIASHDGMDIGGHVVCYTASVATYVLGATGRGGREMRTGYALTWRSVENAIARGISIYDLGGVDESKNPQGYEFKTRMGGQTKIAFGPIEAKPLGLTGMLTDFSEMIYRRLRR